MSVMLHHGQSVYVLQAVLILSGRLFRYIHCVALLRYDLRWDIFIQFSVCLHHPALSRQHICLSKCLCGFLCVSVSVCLLFLCHTPPYISSTDGVSLLFKHLCAYLTVVCHCSSANMWHMKIVCHSFSTAVMTIWLHRCCSADEHHFLF